MAFVIIVLSNFTLDMKNKILFSLGYNVGGIIHTLEICARGLTTSAVTCLIGCDTTRAINGKFYFTNYNTVSFIGSFNSIYDSLGE